MSLGWSGLPDSARFKVGFLFIFPKLHGSEMGETGRTTVSFYKVGFSSYLLVSCCLLM
jgi:hypothetical protein